jgi:cellulose synthase operon protein C
MVFLFPSDAALHFALTSGQLPSGVSLMPARVGQDAAGRTWIASATNVPNELPEILRRIGVIVTEAEPRDGHDVAHWLQALPLRRDPTPTIFTDQMPVVFELPKAGELARFVGEMLRLGNDRQAIRFNDHSALLRVVGPPYYTLLSAIDRVGSDGPRAFLERAPRVWIEVGWTHPLAERLKAPEGQALFLRPPRQWTAIADAPFRDVYELLDLQLPAQTNAWSDDPPADKLSVPLRLTAGSATEPAELWVLRGDAVEQIDSLVRDADDRLLARLAFATGGRDGERVAVVRTRPGKTAAPVLALENALTCRSYLRLPNLYLPVGQRLRPPLRRETVRRLLADDPDEVVWLVPTDADSFVAQSLPESAFRPLADWVEHVMDRDSAALNAWTAAARFEFESFVGRDDRQLTVGESPRDRPKPRRAAAAVAEAAKARLTAAKPKAVATAPVIEMVPAPPPASPTELQVRLKKTESQFMAVDGPPEDHRRLSLWPALGQLYSLLGHRADAGIAWANAIWEEGKPPATWSWNWVEAEQALAKPELTAADLDQSLAIAQPAAPDLRPLAAALVWGSQQKPIPAELRRRLPEVRLYLERHDHLLPVRVLWLTWHGLFGADVLTLARVRDRVLERLLADGLNAERDLPGFLRFAGQRDGNRSRPVRERAEHLRTTIHRWFEKSVSLKGKFDCTKAYIDMLFAFGMARLGEASAARDLLRQAAAGIELVGTEAHNFLLQAFQYRVEQALAGRPHSGPLPMEQREYLDQMRQEEKTISIDDTARRSESYAIERLSSESAILEPQEKLDPYRRIKSEQDDLIREVIRLTDIHDRGLLAQRIRRVAEQAIKSRPLTESRLRVLTELLGLASRVGEEATVDLLNQIGLVLNTTAGNSVIAEHKAILLERALFFAGHYDRPEMVRAFAERLGELLVAPAGYSALDAIGKLVGQTLRNLRKMGLKDQTERLLELIAGAALGGRSLEQAQASVAGRDWQIQLRLLLHLAAGWFYFEKPGHARPILDAARSWILSPAKKANDPDRPAAQYVSLVATYIATVGQVPVDEALARIEEIFTSDDLDRLPNTLTSNNYYSLLHLNIAEAVVLTMATDDFALGPAARRWLDDDEYLVRRRIHRDMRAALAKAGM